MSHDGLVTSSRRPDLSWYAKQKVAPNVVVECAGSRLACATRELIGVIGDRWSVLVLIELGDHGPDPQC